MASATMARRFPAPWREEKFWGGYVVRDATGQVLAQLYARSTESEAIEAKQLTLTRRGDRGQHREAAGATQRVREQPTIAVSLLEVNG
jgi:hypothetical protein